MTYIDTRTRAEEVLMDVAAEVRAQAARVINDAMTHRNHPTYIRKTDARDNLRRLHGAHELATRVFGGVDQYPDGLEDFVKTAYRAFTNEWGLL